MGDSMPEMSKVEQTQQETTPGNNNNNNTTVDTRNSNNIAITNGKGDDDLDVLDETQTKEDEFDFGDDDTDFISILTQSGAYNYGESRQPDQIDLAKSELKTLKKGKNWQNKRLAMNKTKGELSNDPYAQLFLKYKKLSKKFKKPELKQLKKYILSNKIDINKENNVGDEATSFIACVAQSNNCKLLEFLITDCNGDVNAQDSYGYSLLHVAAANGYKMMIKMLFKRGADKNIKAEQDDDRTPLDIADDSVRYLFTTN